jgi:hypothetical protein
MRLTPHYNPCCRVQAGRHCFSPHLKVMNLDLTDEETAALTKELHDIVENDRYPFSPRIRTLRAILGELRPESGPRALAAAEGLPPR